MNCLDISYKFLLSHNLNIVVIIAAMVGVAAYIKTGNLQTDNRS